MGGAASQQKDGKEAVKEPTDRRTQGAAESHLLFAVFGDLAAVFLAAAADTLRQLAERSRTP